MMTETAETTTKTADEVEVTNGPKVVPDAPVLQGAEELMKFEAAKQEFEKVLDAFISEIDSADNKTLLAMTLLVVGPLVDRMPTKSRAAAIAKTNFETGLLWLEKEVGI